MTALAVLFFFVFCLLAWKNFRLGACFFILLLPAYLIRFDFWRLPTTLLEISFGALFLVWLIKFSRADWPRIKIFIRAHKIFSVALGIFFIASVVSIFVSDMPIPSLGEWRAYFLEPMILLFILLGRGDCFGPSGLAMTSFLAYSSISVSVLAILQKISGQFYPPSLWDDQLGGRVTSFFTSPNAVGLFLGPIFILTAALLIKKFRWDYFLILIAQALALFFSFSRGAWVAVALGLLLFAFLIGYKKIALAMAVVGVLAFFSLLALRPALLNSQSSKNRLELWSYSWQFFSASPKNFVLGAGVRQFFRKVQKPHYNVHELERLTYPHNIFLNFWSETGLLGALSFVGIFVSSIYIANKKRKSGQSILGAAVICALVVLALHGMVDVPYFKNDLAMLFWILIAAAVT